jgi:hypothetical protein
VLGCAGGSGDGREGGGAEREDDGGYGGDPEEGVWAAGGDREAVDVNLQAERFSEQDLMLAWPLVWIDPELLSTELN